jgi:predicted peptidase
MTKNILSITAIAEVFPDGQKITAAAIEFDHEIDTGQLSPALFHVSNRTVIKAYANTDPAFATQGRNGRFVILELSPDDVEAKVLPQPAPPSGGPGGQAGPDARKELFPRIPLRVRKPITVCVRQLYDINAIDGTVLPASEEIKSDTVLQPVVDDFCQDEFKGIPYNIVIPKDYDEKKPYPLVMFMADASCNSRDPFLPLIQGIGGVIWATPEEQSKHPSFVLVPQVPYGTRLTKDDFTASPELDIVKELLDDVVNRYSIDRNRIYTTGQSQGCMASCELNIRYPDYFAASLLVSGQWDPAGMATLTDKHLFIALSEGGPKEFPGMNAVVAALEAAGANVARAYLNARKNKEELDHDVRELIETGANILYAVYDAQTVLPDDGKEYPRILHHHRGWEITYAIEAVRDWLFSQVKR